MFELYLILARLINIYQGVMVVYILLSWLPGAYDSKLGIYQCSVESFLL